MTSAVAVADPSPRARPRFVVPTGPVATGLAGAVCIAFSAIFVRLAHVSPATAAFFRCLDAIPVLWWLARRERRRYGLRVRRDRLLAFGAGALLAVDLVAWHRSIELVGAGLATVLANTQVVLVALLAWALLGERPSRRSAVAVPVVLVGVVLISGVAGGGAYGEDPVLGAAIASFSALAYSAFLLILRRGSRDLRHLAGPLLDVTVAATVVAGVVGLALGDLDLAPSLPATGWLGALALTSQVVGWLLITSSLPRLPAAQTSILLTVQPVGSVALGVLIFAEAPSAVQFAGVGVIIAGVLWSARRAPAAGRAGAT